ncbi:HAD-IIIC family phosphatase [Sphingobacteriales bacterium CHB3]|nr:HAD-IIIC family phosphatase [Sphingobacteriales bacterium CHB3]
MTRTNLHGLLISDFTIKTLANYLDNIDEIPKLHTHVVLIRQLIQILTPQDAPSLSSKPDFAVVWTRPDVSVPAFSKILHFQSAPVATLMSEVDAFAEAVAFLGEHTNAVFVPSWTLPSYIRGNGMLDMKNAGGAANAIMRMNLRLTEQLEPHSNIFVLNAQRWIEVAGKLACNPKLWYMGKIAFSNDVFREAARDIKAGLRGMRGLARKLVIVDLDDTLWGGIVGDVGWQQLNLGGHNHIGEAYVDFQLSLKDLTRRGIILGIVSKNEESVALEAIKNHPEMVLRVDDFAGWRINWGDKANNIVQLTASLNLGLESVVFIDDNPVERARVREALPEVFVPEWPKDKMLYQSTLLDLRCFDVPGISSEDLERTQMYLAQKRRDQSQRNITSMDDWLRTLETTVTVEEFSQTNALRVVQLLNKTNQMNHATRRMTLQELNIWIAHKNRHLWAFRVADKFGDAGITGIISLNHDGEVGTITDLVLSCRVMGRRIEETMLFVLINFARRVPLVSLKAEFVPTEKNKPCLEFWRRSPFQEERTNLFTFDLSLPYEVPSCIVLQEGTAVPSGKTLTHLTH